mgnify:CR=1 FL=1
MPLPPHYDRIIAAPVGNFLAVDADIFWRAHTIRTRSPCAATTAIMMFPLRHCQA